jgi:biopolymer transport protein ExbD
MRLPAPHRVGGRLEANMTPMIDVIFLLLIFFVCTASFQMPEQVLPTNLSLAGAIASDVPLDPEELDFEEVVIKLLIRDGQVAWEVNQRAYADLGQVHQILLALATVSTDVPVILDSAGDVPLGHVIDLCDLCRLSGFEKVQFAARAAP